MDKVLGVLGELYGESEVNECIQRIISISDPNEAIDSILAFLGEKCACERTYIFEINKNETCSNTYEWCSEGIEPQKDLLQDEPIKTLQWWWDLFENNHLVIIQDLEDIRETHPQVYAGLKPQGITALIAAPIRLNGALIGFLGVDNPDLSRLDSIATLLSVMGNFLSFIIERRNLVDRLKYMSYHDQLTGALNRYAYGEAVVAENNFKSLGVVYGNISGLKKTNENMGNETGDKLILYCYDLLKNVFSEEQIYRIGGDEFVVLCFDLSEKQFSVLITQLKSLICQNNCHMSIGSAWSDDGQISVQNQVLKAEEEMYRDKYSYHNEMNSISGRLEQRECPPIRPIDLGKANSVEIEIENFFKSNCFDSNIFFDSISMTDYYPFIGDLQSNYFYICDEMKETFGFQANTVYDLVGEWEKRITDPEELDMYRKDMISLLNREKNVHDLRYRVKDKDGNDIWVHCRGMIKWNPEGTKPIFFSGGVSRQERNFIVDPVTNFLREYSATTKLRELQSKNSIITIIGFTLNNFAEVNELRGRNAADVFLRDISRKLLRHFETKLTFYRLDGMRFIAIVSPDCEENIEDMIQQLKEIISSLYYSNNIVVRIPCSVGVICEVGNETSPQDMLVNMASLLATAKHSAEEKYIIHSPVNINIQRARTQMNMELNKNVVEGFDGFRIVVQPTVSTEDFTVISGEVLLRWQFKGRDVSPGVFIPMLENNRLILPVGKWVFEQAVRTCKRITTTYLPHFRLAVNVSYYQILDPEFLPFMEKTLQKYNLAGNRLILEITETHYDETPTKVLEFVQNCKKLGIGVAIDDFGNGYSSLAFLLKYPANIVKLDRSLINEMVNSKDNINFVSSIVYACHKFGKKVCAEGVETKAELDIIRGAGCDMIQGYYFYKPMELNEFYKILPQIKQKKDILEEDVLLNDYPEIVEFLQERESECSSWGECKENIK